MHVDVITTLSLKDDDGKEITRTTAKARTISFTTGDEMPTVERRIVAALTRAKSAAIVAVTAVLADLTS